MTKIFELRTGLSSKYTEFMQTKTLFNPSNYDYKKEIEAIKNGVLSFKTLKIKKWADLTTFSGIYFGFSPKFIQLVNNNDIINFSSYKIKIIFPEYSPAYYYLDIQCKKIRRFTKKKKGLMDLDSIYFDLKDWGGEDLFTIEDTLIILCTEKVKNLVEKSKLKNFRFVEGKPV